MATNKEIERKFLVAEIPEDINKYPHEEILQGYIVISPDGTEVRLRQKSDKYFQTVKAGDGKIRNEYEIEIIKEQFDGLWPATEGRRVEKTRYNIFGEKDELFELDIYREKLEGLIPTVEVEFQSEEASDAFIPPVWFGEEITEDKRYKNQNLALFGIPK